MNLGIYQKTTRKPRECECRFQLCSGVVIAAVKASGGIFVAVGEKDILPGREALARLGFYVELTSAIAWPALAQTIRDLDDPVVVVLTGSGLKRG